MPRPTAAQLVYGSATVVCSTVALLLLFRATTGPGVALVGVAALLLGLLVTLAGPVRSRAKAARTADTAGTAVGAAPPAEPLEVRVLAPRARTGEHSLRR